MTCFHANCGTSPLYVLLITILLSLTLASGSADAVDSLQVARVSDGHIRIDGDLSDWQGLPGTVIDGKMDHMPPWRPVSQDRAFVRFSIDREAVYIGIRVVDDVHKPDADNLYRGDNMYWHIDVRPVNGPEGTPILGRPAYSPGVYQIALGPPASSGGEVSWACSEGQPGGPEHLDAAAIVLDDGYTIEARIPFEELNGSSPERFTHPVGLSVGVSDRDEGEQSGGYSLAPDHDPWRDASLFRRGIPTDAPWVERNARFYPPRSIGGGANRVVAAVISPEELPDSALELFGSYSGSAFDRDSSNVDSRPVLTDSLVNYHDPSLDLWTLARVIAIETPVGGRYTFASRLDLVGQVRTDTTRGYYREADKRLYVFSDSVDDAAIARELMQQFRLAVWPNHVYNDSTVRVRISNRRISPMAAWHASERAEQGDTMSVYQWRLDVADAENRSIRSLSLPVSMEEVEASIDLASLAEGQYRVRPSIVTPGGAAERVWYQPDPPRVKGNSADRFVVIHRGAVPTVETHIADGPNPFTRLRLLGNPGLHQFPTDDPSDCRCRSVSDLQLHDKRIYVGTGGDDRGPIDIWSFDPISFSGFEKEFTVDDELVHMLRDFDGRLLVPGNDATASWEFGNLYIKEAGEWRKLRTIPNGIHVLGIVVHQGRLFVTTGTELGPALYASDDDGETWTRYGVDEEDGRWDWRFYELGVLGEDLMCAVHQEYVYRYRDGELTRIVTPVFPGLVSDYTSPHRVTSFAGGLLYAAGEWWTTPAAEPLYFVTDLDKGASAVAGFDDVSVRDILVRDGTCYVLTSTKQDSGYFSEILQTVDLATWTRVAEFRTEAMARSLELSGDRFFVGTATYPDSAIPESGNIYVLER